MSDAVTIYALLIFLFSVASIPLISFVFTIKRDIFEPVYWASEYFILIFWIRSIYVLLFGTPFLGIPPFPPETARAWVTALFYLIISFAVFLIGYYSNLGITLATATPFLPRQ